MSLEIRNIPVKDIAFVVAIHNKAFPNFFLTQLGDCFLSLFYKSILHSTHGIMLGCYNKGLLVGFCAATSQSKGFYSLLIRENIFEYGLLALKLIFMHPSALIRLYMNLTKKSPVAIDNCDYAELLSIGVETSFQGTGVGSILLLELENKIKQKNGTKLTLTTDCYNNEKTIAFYTSLGYEVLYDFVSYPNRKMLRYIKSFYSV